MHQVMRYWLKALTTNNRSSPSRLPVFCGWRNGLSEITTEKSGPYTAPTPHWWIAARTPTQRALIYTPNSQLSHGYYGTAQIIRCPSLSHINTLWRLLLHYGYSCIKHPVSDRLKLSFVIFDIRALWRSVLSVRVPGYQKLQMTGCFIAVSIWQQ